MRIDPASIKAVLRRRVQTDESFMAFDGRPVITRDRRYPGSGAASLTPAEVMVPPTRR